MNRQKIGKLSVIIRATRGATGYIASDNEGLDTMTETEKTEFTQWLNDRLIKNSNGCREIKDKGKEYRLRNKDWPIHKLIAHIRLGLDYENSDISVYHKCNNQICFNTNHLLLSPHPILFGIGATT